MNEIGFIGAGKMAKAIITGIFNSADNLKIFVYDRSKNNYSYLEKLNVSFCENGKDVVKNAKYVVLAVKPQNYVEVLEEIKEEVNEKTVIISIAAGIGEEFLASYFDFNIKFVQVMPNTPLLLGAGAVAICRGKNVLEDEFKFSKEIFSKSGVVCEIPKEKMNDIVSINGSSPAFIYYFAKGFLDFAERKQIEKDKALKLFCYSLIGSAKMILDSNKTIDELISDVCSKKGTTEKGIEVLKENNFLKIIEKTCEETAKRAFELSK